MGDPSGGTAGSNDGGLSQAEQDSTQNFWYNDTGQTVAPCGSSAPPNKVSDTKKHWIEIVLVDREGKPVPGENYAVTVPGGQVITGSLNDKGRARIDGIDAGNCKVTFPNVDKDCWEPK